LGLTWSGAIRCGRIGCGWRGSRVRRRGTRVRGRGTVGRRVGLGGRVRGVRGGRGLHWRRVKRLLCRIGSARGRRAIRSRGRRAIRSRGRASVWISRGSVALAWRGVGGGLRLVGHVGIALWRSVLLRRLVILRLVWVVRLLARDSCCDRCGRHGSSATATLQNPKDDDEQGQNAKNSCPSIVGFPLARSYANAVVSVGAVVSAAALVISLLQTHRALLERRGSVGDGLDSLRGSAEEVGPDGFESDGHAEEMEGMEWSGEEGEERREQKRRQKYQAQTEKKKKWKRPTRPTLGHVFKVLFSSWCAEVAEGCCCSTQQTQSSVCTLRSELLDETSPR